MESNLFQIVYNHQALSTDNLQNIKNAHSKVEFSKGDTFLEYGSIANDYYLIEKGLFRSFVHDYSGNEITSGFYGENEILIEVSSLFQRIPTKENFVALTNGTAWQIQFDVFQELYHKIPSFNEWGRSWMSNELFLAKQRSIDMLTKSATDRYLMVLEENPQIIQKAPLKHIASYLGITDTSLSRIRKEIVSE